jgi:osmotically-inducible protein OsmY
MHVCQGVADEIRQPDQGRSHQELRWDPQVTDPDAIGVAVKDGAVTLTGAVSTYAQKFAAVRAASRVYGVEAVADEVTVKPTGEPRDSDIARAIAHILDNNTQIPEGKVHAQVRAGWVTLNGEVEWQYQVQAKIEEAFKREAEIDARHISVAVSDHTARLYGHVHSLNEANAAWAAAASAPGIASVESHLVVTP